MHPARHPLPPIDRLPPRDRQQPGLERRLGPEPRELLEGRDEGLLGHVVRLGRRADSGQGRSQHRAPVPLDQLAKGRHIARLGPPDQDEIGGAGGGSGIARVGGFRDGHTVCRGLRRHCGWVSTMKCAE